MKLKKDKVIKYDKNGKVYAVQPEHVKIEAVKELESGVLSIKEAMLKYEVLSRSTITKWLKEYSQEDKYNPVRHSTESERRGVVKDIESGLISKAEAAKQNNKSIYTIDNWMRFYSCKVNLASKKGQMDSIDRSGQVVINELEQALKEAQLKINGLETLIDISEQEYQLDIRKKFGAKQLK